MLMFPYLMWFFLLSHKCHYPRNYCLNFLLQVDSLAFVNRNMNGDASPEGSSVRAIEDLVDQLDDSKGVLFSSSYEFPGR